MPHAAFYGPVGEVSASFSTWVSIDSSSGVPVWVTSSLGSSWSNPNLCSVQGAYAVDTAVSTVPRPVMVGAEVVMSGTVVATGSLQNLTMDSERYLYTRDKSYDAVAGAVRNSPVFIPQDRYESFDLSATSNQTDGTYSFYVDMDGFTHWSMRVETSVAALTGTVVVYASNDAGTADISTRNYDNIGEELYGSGSFVFDVNKGLNFVPLAVPFMYNSMKIDIVSSTGGLNTGQWTAQGKKGVA